MLGSRTRYIAFVVLIGVFAPLAAQASLELADLYSTNGREIYAQVSNEGTWQRAGTLYFEVEIIHPRSGKVVEQYENHRGYAARARGGWSSAFLANYTPNYSGYKARVHLWYKDNQDEGDLGTHMITLY